MRGLAAILASLVHFTSARSIHWKQDEHAARQVQTDQGALDQYPSTALAGLLLASSPSAGWQAVVSTATRNHGGGRSSSAAQMMHAHDFEGLSSQLPTRRAAVKTAALASLGAGLMPRPAAAIPKPGCNLVRLQLYVQTLDEVKQKLDEKSFKAAADLIAPRVFEKAEIENALAGCGDAGLPEVEAINQNLRQLRSLAAQIGMMGSSSNADLKEAVGYLTDARKALVSFMQKTGFDKEEIARR